MQTHSVDPYTAELYCDMLASFRLTDDTAIADATATATGYNATITQLAQTHDGIDAMSGKWGTFETDGCPLDGSLVAMPDSFTGLQTGMWSNLSDADGVLTGVSLTQTFTADHDSYGFTLAFDDKANWYPKSVTISAYDSADVLMDSKTLDCTSAHQIFDMPITNYRKVVATFATTQKAYQRVRLSDCMFGVIESPDLISAAILYETDPRMKSLPVGELVVTIDNSDEKYNQRSPNSLYSYLQSGQSFYRLEIGLGESRSTIEMVDMGKQFFYTKSAAKNGSMTAEITANDLLYRMDKTTYKKGLSGTDTVANLINAVLTDSGVGLISNIPAAIGARVIGKNIPLVNHREAIRMIAQAARCVAFVGRDGYLKLVDISVGTSTDNLDGTNMLEWPDIAVSDAVNVVNVAVYSFYTRLATDFIMYSGTATISGTQTIWVEYSEGGTSPETVVTGGTLVSAAYYYYGAYLTITASGDVTIEITGDYEVKESSYTYSATSVTGDETEQSLSIDNQLIVSTEIAAAVATYQLGLSRLKYPVTEMGNPARELADTTTIVDAYGGTGDAVVTKQKYTYDGGLQCEMEAVG